MIGADSFQLEEVVTKQTQPLQFSFFLTQSMDTIRRQSRQFLTFDRVIITVLIGTNIRSIWRSITEVPVQKLMGIFPAAVELPKMPDFWNATASTIDVYHKTGRWCTNFECTAIMKAISQTDTLALFDKNSKCDLFVDGTSGLVVGNVEGLIVRLQKVINTQEQVIDIQRQMLVNYRQVAESMCFWIVVASLGIIGVTIYYNHDTIRSWWHSLVEEDEVPETRS